MSSSCNLGSLGTFAVNHWILDLQTVIPNAYGAWWIPKCTMPGQPSNNWTMRPGQYRRVLAPPGELGPSCGTGPTSKAQVAGCDSLTHCSCPWLVAWIVLVVRCLWQTVWSAHSPPALRPYILLIQKKFRQDANDKTGQLKYSIGL